jgi:hypothetical protein
MIIRGSLVLLLTLAEVASAQAPRKASSQRKVAQVVVGSLAASAAGLLAFSKYDGGPGRRVKGDAGYNRSANVAYAFGSWAGSTLMVHMIGTEDGSRAPIWKTALGTGAGSIPLFLGYDEPYLPLLGIVFISPLQSGLGTIAYQESRRTQETAGSERPAHQAEVRFNLSPSWKSGEIQQHSGSDWQHAARSPQPPVR